MGRAEKSEAVSEKGEARAKTAEEESVRRRTNETDSAASLEEVMLALLRACAVPKRRTAGRGRCEQEWGGEAGRWI